jgi:hypothetical protein
LALAPGDAMGSACAALANRAAEGCAGLRPDRVTINPTSKKIATQ